MTRRTSRLATVLATLACLSLLTLYFADNALIVQLASFCQIHLFNGPRVMVPSDFSNFTLDQVNGVDADIPAELRNLDGHRVAIVGDVWNSNASGSSGTPAFYFVTYRPHHAPRVQDFIVCSFANPRSVVPIAVTVHAVGVLHVGTKKENGSIASVFRLDVEQLSSLPAFPDRRIYSLIRWLFWVTVCMLAAVPMARVRRHLVRPAGRR